MIWRKFDGTPLKKPIRESIIEAIKREQSRGHELKICIGTDSQVRGNKTAFATVMVFVRKNKGGFMFVSHCYTHHDLSLRERMIQEVSKSVEFAYSVCDILDKYDIALEVHADINSDPSFKSNIALKEAMGYILSMGYIFKSKPNAYASSSCADRLV